jgi:pyruvate/2-oxoglutarate dehydrogenase complex dihydrolipoamide dehydrogenase (E3) component
MHQQEMLMKKRQERVEKVPSEVVVNGGQVSGVEMGEVQEKIDERMQEAREEMKRLAEEVADRVGLMQKRQEDHDKRIRNNDRLIIEINNHLLD